MDTSFNFVEIWAWQITFLDLLVAVVMVTCLRKVTGLVANLSTTDELSEKDNFAFGITLAGATLSLALMMTGVLSGDAAHSLLNELLSLIGYGALGVLLIKLGRVVLDNWVLKGIEIQKEIKNGNLAAALVDVSNVISVGIMLRAVMIWVEGDQLTSLFVVLAAFVATQLILTLVSYSRVLIFKHRNQGKCLQEALQQGNTALAVRYFGHLVGVSLSITAASGMVIYDGQGWILSLSLWVGVAIIFTVVTTLLSFVARKVILAGINIVEEVDQQQNIGVAAIEASIFISMGLLLIALFV